MIWKIGNDIIERKTLRPTTFTLVLSLKNTENPLLAKEFVRKPNVTHGREADHPVKLWDPRSGPTRGSAQKWPDF